MQSVTLLLVLMLTACATVVPTEEDALTPGIFLEPEVRAVLPQGVELRPVSAQGLGVTKRSEGFRSRLYNDAARYCTIAYGHLIKKAPCDGSEPSTFRLGLTEPQGAELLTTDMAGAQVAVMTMVNFALTDGQYAALCDFVYNVGPSNLQKSELLRAVNAKQFERVPAQFLRWVNAGGRTLEGLRMRRHREIELFFDGLPMPREAPPVGEDLSLIDIRTGR